MSPVGLLIVSHSARLAEGVVEVAQQMAASVTLVAAGGTDDGGVGTSVGKDLGSAVLTAESVLEFLDEAQRPRVRLADAALVEGAVAAAVASAAGAGLEAVARAAEEAVPAALAEEPPELREPTESAALTLVNPLGLHARPAAVLAGRLSAFDVEVTVNGVDGQSVMALMALGAGQGSQLVVEASGPDAARAVDFVRGQVESGFGEI